MSAAEMELAPRESHAALMDSVYRGQRHIYDVTRKYFLFGRDRLIHELQARPGQSLLELGCGTGRNLQLAIRQCPGIEAYGLDISEEMLKNARRRLPAPHLLVQGDATRFDANALFDKAGFDHVMISYALSMIPQWRDALVAAVDALDVGGCLHIVDFGDLGGLPRPLRAALRGWLAQFHVSPRLDLADIALALATERGLHLASVRGPWGYYQMVRLTRPLLDHGR